MRRSVLVGALTLALLFIGSIALVAWRTAIAPAQEAPPATAMAERTPGAASGEPTLAQGIAGSAAADPPMVQKAPTPGGPPALEGSPPARTSPAPPISTLRPPSRAVSKFLRRELTTGSGELRAALVRCAGRESLRGQPAVLMLEIETLDGEVRIVDAHVQTRGDASPALVACAQETLRDRLIAAPDASPGDLHRMPFALAFWEAG